MTNDDINFITKCKVWWHKWMWPNVKYDDMYHCTLCLLSSMHWMKICEENMTQALFAIQQCIGSSRLAAISALERSHGLTSCDWGGTLIANVTFLFPQSFSEQLNICALEVFVKYSVFRFG